MASNRPTTARREPCALPSCGASVPVAPRVTRAIAGSKGRSRCARPAVNWASRSLGCWLMPSPAPSRGVSPISPGSTENHYTPSHAPCGRVPRNNADFQQLLQICGLNQTLIGDADAIYDLTQLNDRPVLGLKGTMSEAELFTMRARLQGGLRHKAARGELATKLPIGFVYAPAGKITLDQDQHVQEAIQLLFTTFRQVGSSIGVVRYFNQHGLTFPTRPMKGPHHGEVWWTALSSSLTLRILHNPRYAGAFAYGRTRLLQSPSGGASYQKRSREDWHALVQQ